jgi:hypothetical protein
VRPSRPFSWVNARPLWQARNDRLATWLGDPTDDRRRAWMEGRMAANPELLVDRSASDVAFLVLGDTGEGDASQYAVVPPLLSQADGTAFTFICGDVIYPAGGVDSYEEKFFRPYRDYPGTIYAVPGNHDWYDDLVGFMHWFCGVDPPPPSAGTHGSARVRARDALWRRLPPPGSPATRAVQPGPYFAIDAGPLRLVGIDTGIRRGIDRDQGEWLKRVSASSPRPKVLLTGSPIYVDGEHQPCPIEGGGTVDEVITAPESNYVAAIGGDVHNYQRYPVRLPDGRTLMYLVSGGGGAFMHATHTIPNLDRLGLPGVSEGDFRCYPLRGDSLSRFSQLWSRKRLGLRLGARFLAPDVAAAIVAEQLGLEPARTGARVDVGPADRRAAQALFGLPVRGRGVLHLPFSQYLDFNEPPLFKSFLRVDAGDADIRIRCFAATGCGEHESAPPLEDDLRATRAADGRWEWSLAHAPE